MGRDLFAVVLPARYNSSRFPGKPLAQIAGRPLIEWVYRRARQIRGVGALLVATDDDRIAETVRSLGGEVVMTRGDHETGTDRVAEVAGSLEFGYVVNLQGDEPIFDPVTVEAMMDRLAGNPGTDIVTACHPLVSDEEKNDPNVVKVVVDRRQRALYFSRSPIPHGTPEQPEGAPDSHAGRGRPRASVDSAGRGRSIGYRHVGIYAYTRDALLRFAGLPRSPLERSERLEQLRALENGMTISVVISSTPTIGVDTPEDIKKVEKEISRIYTD